MKKKVYSSLDEVVADVPDGARIMFGGFGGAGFPNNLIQALVRKGVKSITAIRILCERMRAAGAGLQGFYTTVGVGTEVAGGKEERVLEGKRCVLEMPLHADYAFIKAQKADELGNLTYRLAARNFNPIMAMAAKTTIAEVEELVPVGSLEPEHVVTPAIFVDRIVQAKGVHHAG